MLPLALIQPLHPGDPVPANAIQPSAVHAFLAFCIAFGLLVAGISAYRQVWRAQLVWTVLAFVGASSIAVWIASLAALGGSPLNGAVEQGRYFAGEHGYYWEISRTTYYVARAQTFFTLAFLPVFILALHVLRRARHSK